MARIVHKRIKKFKPHIAQVLSALLLIAVIIISNLNIDNIFKLFAYIICIILNIELINSIFNGISSTTYYD